MTKQKIFEVLNSITKLDGDILAQVKVCKEEYTETNIHKYSYAGNERSFVALLNLLESDIKQEEYLKAAKASGKTATEKKRIAAAKKILSANSEHRPRMQYAAVKDGRQIVVNPYQIVRFNTVLPLPECPEKLAAEQPDYFDKMNNLIPPDTAGMLELELPDLVKLKAWYKVESKKPQYKDKGGKKLLYCFGNVYADPKLLINMMEAMPNAKAFNKGYFNMIYMESTDAVGGLMPNQPPKDKDGNYIFAKTDLN